ncbi:hypothetical protein [Rhizobium sp. CECT 9324]|uniref:hypothetical protein n=1 Tax=Rhizobium sp. CECT 9324 TaxID=2845820 RepID=UPI001E38014B|nr:hypothetical protein [Rhizobium sp. CECT 9324]CAH0343678.1 hypothetical protein RHI9324_05415 [Rhizobium sp. CECT 9324]
MTTYAIAVGVDTDELRVMETDDNFGAFDTREAAAARMIEMIDGRMETLRRSKLHARRIIRSAAN